MGRKRNRKTQRAAKKPAPVALSPEEVPQSQPGSITPVSDLEAPADETNSVAKKIADLMGKGYSPEEAARLAGAGINPAAASDVPGYRTGPEVQTETDIEVKGIRIRHAAWLARLATNHGTTVDRVIHKIIAEAFAKDATKGGKALQKTGVDGTGGSVPASMHVPPDSA